MPLHEYDCTGCNHPFEVVRHFGETVDVHPCPKCQGVGRRVWSVPTVRPDIEPHYCEQLDAYVGSRKGEKQAMKQIYEQSEGKISVDWH